MWGGVDVRSRQAGGATPDGRRPARAPVGTCRRLPMPPCRRPAPSPPQRHHAPRTATARPTRPPAADRRRRPAPAPGAARSDGRASSRSCAPTSSGPPGSPTRSATSGGATCSAPTTPSCGRQLARHGGTEVKTSGDGFLVTFASARERRRASPSTCRRMAVRAASTRRAAHRRARRRGRARRQRHRRPQRLPRLPAVRRRRARRGARVGDGRRPRRLLQRPRLRRRPRAAPRRHRPARPRPPGVAPADDHAPPPSCSPPGARHRASPGPAPKLLAAVPRHGRSSPGPSSTPLDAGLDEVIVVVGAVDVPGRCPPASPSSATTGWAERHRHVAARPASARPGRAATAPSSSASATSRSSPAEAWRRVAAATATPIAVATYDGERGNPVRLGRRGVGRACPIVGDEGARRADSGAAGARDRSTVPGFGRRHRHRGGPGRVELTNEFRVGVPVEQAWAVLTDVERIAPCLPGAQLQEIEGDEYRGIVKVKVGPITAQYKGAATFVERRGAHTGGAAGRGPRDPRPGQRQRHASPPLLEPDGDGTKVDGRHRPHHHRQGRPVRSGRARRRVGEAARPSSSSASSRRCSARTSRPRRRRPRPSPTPPARPAAGPTPPSPSPTDGEAADPPPVGRGRAGGAAASTSAPKPSRSTSSAPPAHPSPSGSAPVARRHRRAVAAPDPPRAAGSGDAPAPHHVNLPVPPGRVGRRWPTSTSRSSASPSRRGPTPAAPASWLDVGDGTQVHLSERDGAAAPRPARGLRRRRLRRRPASGRRRRRRVDATSRPGRAVAARSRRQPRRAVRAIRRRADGGQPTTDRAAVAALLGRGPRRVRGRRPPRRRLAARDPQRPAARRRHADAHPLLAGRRARARRWSAGSRPPAASTGPRPRSTPARSPPPTPATPPSATPPCRPDWTGPAAVRRRRRHPHRASSACTPTTPGTSPAATTRSAAGSTTTSTRSRRRWLTGVGRHRLRHELDPPARRRARRRRRLHDRRAADAHHPARAGRRRHRPPRRRGDRAHARRARASTAR